jgi:hypothetical protein
MLVGDWLVVAVLDDGDLVVMLDSATAVSAAWRCLGGEMSVGDQDVDVGRPHKRGN